MPQVSAHGLNHARIRLARYSLSLNSYVRTFVFPHNSLHVYQLRCDVADGVRGHMVVVDFLHVGGFVPIAPRRVFGQAFPGLAQPGTYRFTVAQFSGPDSY